MTLEEAQEHCRRRLEELEAERKRIREEEAAAISRLLDAINYPR